MVDAIVWKKLLVRVLSFVAISCIGAIWLGREPLLVFLGAKHHKQWLELIDYNWFADQMLFQWTEGSVWPHAISTSLVLLGGLFLLLAAFHALLAPLGRYSLYLSVAGLAASVIGMGTVFWLLDAEAQPRFDHVSVRLGFGSQLLCFAVGLEVMASAMARKFRSRSVTARACKASG